MIKNLWKQIIPQLKSHTLKNFRMEGSTDKSSENEEMVIPDWIKNNAAWWADGQIDDTSFVQGIQYLIKEGIMKIEP